MSKNIKMNFSLAQNLELSDPEWIAEGMEFVLFSAKDKNQRMVAVKTLLPGVDADKAEFILRNEYSILLEAGTDGIRKTLGFEKTGKTPVLLLEYCPGMTFREIAVSTRPSVEQWLTMALGAARSIRQLHKQGYIHRDISGENLIYNPADGKVSLIDLASGISIQSGSGKKEFQHAGAGALEYLSPELTNRTQLPVDQRSDLYSLGMVLFEIATGKPPFQGADAITVVHAHLAEPCPDASSMNPDFPKPLAAVISKLAAKNPEERYQSALGLERELERCLESFRKDGRIEAWQPGELDTPFGLSLSSKLYGRDQEIFAFQNVLKNASKGSKSILLLNGKSGTGKSRLVQTFMDSARSKGTLCISGKGDQYSRETPLLSFRSAMAEWMSQVFTMDADSRDVLRRDLIECLGDNAGLLENLVPGLMKFLQVTDLGKRAGLEEEKNKFNYTARSFFKCIAERSAPLFIFLDDMQFADSGTLNLLEQIILPTDDYPLLLVLSSRTEDVEGNPLWKKLLQDLRSGHRLDEDLVVDDLPEREIRQFLADSFRAPEEQVAELSKVLFSKTKGNIFFSIEFLKVAESKGCLYFDPEAGRWNWDLDTIASLDAYDNVAEFLTGRISQFPAELQSLLSFIACYGNHFKINKLAIASGQDEHVLEENLRSLIQEGAISFSKGSYHLQHDKIQQAAYTLLSPEEVTRNHLRIAQNLEAGAVDGEDNFLEIATHYLYAENALAGSAQKARLAELMLRAGNQALKSSVFRSATSFFQCGIRMLGAEGWKASRATTLALHEGAAQAAFLSGGTEAVKELANVIIANSASPLERKGAVEVLCLLYFRDGRLKECIETGIRYINELGIRMPTNPGMPKIMLEVLKAEITLKRKKYSNLSSLPLMTKPEARVAMNLFPPITSAAYLFNPPLVNFLAIKNFTLCLDYGRGPLFPMALYYYAATKCVILFHVEEGRKMAELAEREMEDPDTGKFAGFTHFGLATHVYPWFRDIHDAYDLYENSCKVSLQNGDLASASYSLAHQIVIDFLSGNNLRSLTEKGRKSVELLKEYRQEYSLNLCQAYLQAATNLMDPTGSPTQLEGEWFSKSNATAAKQIEDRTVKTGIHFLEMILGLIYQDFKAAAESARKVRADYSSIQGTFYWGIFPVLEGICELRATGKQGLSRANANLKVLKKFSKGSKVNFDGKALLLEAEICRVQENREKALYLYSLALQSEKAQRFSLFEALTAELMGRYQMECGLNILGEETISQANHAYGDWDADHKVKSLAEEFPGLVQEQSQETTHARRYSRSLSVGSLNLDVDTVLKASAAISKEFILENLVKQLLKFTAENAGATRAIFFLPGSHGSMLPFSIYEKGEFRMPQSGDTAVMQSLFPERVIQYAFDSESSVIGPQATALLNFDKDPYFKAGEVRSFMCLPLFNLGKPLAALYMENSLVSGAFTAQRVELLTALSGQIAISVQNALLYENLEQKVEERTHQLREKKEEIERQQVELVIEKKKSDDLLLNILPAEVAEELKQTGKASARDYQEVSIMFLDIISFTRIAEKLRPEELVSDLDGFFGEIDKTIGEFGIEKIKTIGDAYLCVSGLPHPVEDHAIRLVRAALKISDRLGAFNRKRKEQGKLDLDFRIGIHSGPLVAGVVGTRKFAYDIWGESVNTAARMEQNSKAGRINISGATYELVKDHFQLEQRGKVEAKNMGLIDMYFVNGELVADAATS